MSQSKLVSEVDGLVIRKSGPWIKRKYYYLTRYLQIFSVGMKKKWDLVFIDLFAGPGRCIIEETGEEEEGSALKALQYNFTKYIFVEQDRGCLDALKTRCEKSPKHQQITFIEKDCNNAVDDILKELSPKQLVLIFADPTKINIQFETLQRLTYGRGADLLINVQSGMDIKRNFNLYRRQGDSSTLGLFLGGNVPWDEIKESKDAVAVFKKRIRALGYSTVEFKDIEVTNTKKAPMYFLFFASKNPKGIAFWKRITARDDQGQYEFEDLC